MALSHGPGIHEHPANMCWAGSKGAGSVGADLWEGIPVLPELDPDVGSQEFGLGLIAELDYISARCTV